MNSELYYETIGNGPALLMMHGGLGLSHDYLRPYFDQLAEDYTLIYYDHFGNGRSGRPNNFAELTFDRFIADGADLMAHLGHENYTLIGHSYGGFIAQEFAAKRQEALNSLVLISTVPALDYQPQFSGTDAQMAAFGRMFSGPMTSDEEWREAWSTAVEMYFHKYDDVTGRALDGRTVYEHRAWNVSGELLATFNTLDVLPKVSTPSLVMSGRHDGIAPPDSGGERIADLMPNAKLRVFENSAHYSFIEEEDTFFKELKGWLKHQT
ncbi:MAG: alpha/beta fold hydrolase [Rhizobiaceae bacterium]